ncbi:pre-mRNA splicing factor [Trichosporon asahii var. asahii CBS 2479]|uniref:Small nuclear ribonucleoprotein Sm D3 n=1 Tax=Trichosporon asahii var. asahii (strain ATCC 90039 / CBS 2479 / JCM 2466 / KCTC 7840 / NBRC 103889/ NCYC 2677 / UAMH 7654) TaxID=1186058 RepID=J5R869_TRIAS|nr:pre-mRNA splicing factor [Trichosporon asahii var. asahii CBS 2479]EJT51213.1 pre-mRNA splicing factor [Trichosporon asahii var. asahii CBS 2479]
MANLGVPVKLLHESLGHIVTVELKTGEMYRGKLMEAEDSLNMALKDITVTARDGRVSQLEQVYIRGSMEWALCIEIWAIDTLRWARRVRLKTQIKPSRLLSFRTSSPFSSRWPVGWARAGSSAPSPLSSLPRRSYASVFTADIQVRFIIVPDLLAHAPMFKRVGPNAMRGRGIGAARGRATIQRAISRRGGQPRSQGVRR